MNNIVVLVDENNKQVGLEDKIIAHKEGKLHRAFSIFIINKNNEMLLQKRAKRKYHSGGLWANACCSHPKSAEITNEELNERLMEEMGFNCKLKKLFHFIYRNKFNNGLTEHEYDFVFLGSYNGKIKPNPLEVEDYKWVPVYQLKKEIKDNPDIYTIWFKIAFNKLIEKKMI